MAALGLDLTKNLSYYTVRIHALQCVPAKQNLPKKEKNVFQLTNFSLYSQIPAAFVACLAPHMFAVLTSGKVYDNAKPRNFNDSVDKAATLDTDVSFFVFVSLRRINGVWRRKE